MFPGKDLVAFSFSLTNLCFAGAKVNLKHIKTFTINMSADSKKMSGS
jgi:hypothetical protein